MTLKKWSLALIAVALVAPVSASALGISIVNTSFSGDSLMQNGDTVTFDLLLENNTGEDISGVDIGVWGYDNGGDGSAQNDNLNFTGATSAASVFNTVFVPGSPNQAFGGLDAAVPINEIGNPIVGIERRAILFGSVALTSADGTGLDDVGVNGNQTGPGGDVHFQVTFTAQSLGADSANPASVTLNFGNGAFGLAVAGPGGQLPTFSDSITLTIVPEPGTALLMGLGLVGLAGTRRR